MGDDSDIGYLVLQFSNKADIDVFAYSFEDLGDKRGFLLDSKKGVGTHKLLIQILFVV